MSLDPLALFQDVAATVPAYRHFLREHRVDPARTTTLDDFRTVPLVSKENYLRAYPLPDRCRGGSLDGCETIALPSGEPTVWPRTLADELAGEVLSGRCSATTACRPSCSTTPDTATSKWTTAPWSSPPTAPCR